MKGKENGQYKSDFSINLRALFAESGKHQMDLAKAIGKTRQTVSLYYNGQAKPDIETLAKIAEYFNVTTDWLLDMPNASKEINADKYQAMKTTGLSEKAIDNLITLYSHDRNKAANWLIGSDDFVSGIEQLSQAVVAAMYSDDDSSVYRLILDNPSSKSPFVSEPPYMYAHEMISILTSCGFRILENGFNKNLMHLLKLKKEAPNNGFDIINVLEGNDNGNDNSTEE